MQESCQRGRSNNTNVRLSNAFVRGRKHHDPNFTLITNSVPSPTLEKPFPFPPLDHYNAHFVRPGIPFFETYGRCLQGRHLLEFWLSRPPRKVIHVYDRASEQILFKCETSELPRTTPDCGMHSLVRICHEMLVPNALSIPQTLNVSIQMHKIQPRIYRIAHHIQRRRVSQVTRRGRSTKREYHDTNPLGQRASEVPSRIIARAWV